MVEEVAPRLRLTLHERYTRPDVYGLFGINYDTRHTRHLNTGLSPALPDGGYFIFITLDKGTIAYDYEDELFRDQLIWVTRRDRDENDPAYVALRQPGIRVSLFARRADKEPFAYLGEVRWTDHEQFSNERRLQQRYVLKLRVPVPDGLLAELNGGAAQRSYTPTQTRPTTAPANLPAISRPRTRRPATLDEYHRAFRYALGTLEREVVPAHQHYQMRLRAHFEAKGVPAEWERDFIDVRWEHGGVTWIGEVKLTRYLSAAEAFRTALGQLLVYGLPTSPSRLGW